MKALKKISITSALLLLSILSFSQDSVSCSEIEREVDGFTGEITLSTPIVVGSPTTLKVAPMSIIKYIKNGKSSYCLNLIAYGVTAVVDGIGTTVIFTDGTKWSKTNKIDVDATSSGLKYSTFITLTPTDLTLFSTKKISKFRLYIFDEEVNLQEAEQFSEHVKCIKIAK